MTKRLLVLRRSSFVATTSNELLECCTSCPKHQLFRAIQAGEDLGGADFPQSVARPEAVEPVWRYEFAQALAEPDRDEAAKHFVDGVWVLISALPAKPALLGELEAAFKRLKPHDAYLPERVLYQAGRYGNRSAYDLLRRVAP